MHSFKNFSYTYKPDIKCYYPISPFHPPAKYPELSFVNKIDKKNKIYPIVRELLQKIGMDKEHFGYVNWSPFRDIVKPGDTVLIKPNLVTHDHYLGGDAILSTLVHGSVLRPIIDYVRLALKGRGNILIADTPVEPAVFQEIMAKTGIEKMVYAMRKYGFCDINTLDLRSFVAYRNKSGTLIRKEVDGDPLGYVTVDLEKDSCFAELDTHNVHYYTLADKSVDHLDPETVNTSMTDTFHNKNSHKYIVSKSILNADVIINVAKLKTHCKAGVSLCLKNMIGIVTNKDCMPHHRPGAPPTGDSYPNIPPGYFINARKFYRQLMQSLGVHRIPAVRYVLKTMRKKKIIVGQQVEHGNWVGNDTIWRTILDVNRIAYYADKNGKMKDIPQRKIFCVIDGIISQEGDAPVSGQPIRAGIILGGYNPVILDAYATKIMGIDYTNINTITNALHLKKWKLVRDNVDLSFRQSMLPNLKFSLPKGWQ